MNPENTNLKDVLILVAPLTDYPDSHSNSGTPDFESIRIVTPIDALYASGNLLAQGFSVDIFNVGLVTGHSNRRNEFRSYVAKHKYRVMIVLPPILTFATAQDFTGEDFIGILTESNPEAIAIVGGTYPTNFPGKLSALGKCDFELVGEFENSVTKLLQTLRDSNYEADLAVNITGVISARESIYPTCMNPLYDTVSLESLPVIDYRWLGNDFLDKYAAVVERGKIRYPEKSKYYVDIMTSRGCSLRCSFCSVSHFRGNNIKRRTRPIDAVVTEVRQALDAGVKEIHFFDDLFANNEAEIYNLLNQFALHNLKFPWFVAQGLNLWFLNREILTAMHASGMYRLIAPFESGSNRVLREEIGKIHSTVEKHQEVISAVENLDIELIGMFVVGLPGETRSELASTVRFAKNNPRIDYTVFSIATPMHGTRMTKKLPKLAKNISSISVDSIIKRTHLLYTTEEFTPLDLGLIRTFEWERINFSTQKRVEKYCKMVGLTQAEFLQTINFSKDNFYRYFPDYNGTVEFRE